MNILSYRNLEELLVNDNEKFPVLFRSKDECCGCSACFSVCPVGAIKMEDDLEGFSYPLIDVKKCVKCGQCIRVCPLKQ